MTTSRRQWIGGVVASLGTAAVAPTRLFARSDTPGGIADSSKAITDDTELGRSTTGLRRNASLQSYPYSHFDVFTDAPLTGNQLAVFLEPAGLSGEQMLAIARELNFSETTFVFPAEAAGTDFRVRIFTVSREMEFAGHPVIGTAFALARGGAIAPGTESTVFGLGIGPTDVSLEWGDDGLSFAWMTQSLPTFGPMVSDIDGLATGLGLSVEALRAPGLPFQEVSCGNPFFYVPLATRADVDGISIRRDAMLAVYQEAGMTARAIYAFSTEPGSDGGTVYSRMLGLRGFEDPATGSAAGPMGCYLVRHGVVAPGEADGIVCIQGVAMRRPSRIYVRIAGTPQDISGVQVGGRSAFVGEGSVRTAS